DRLAVDEDVSLVGVQQPDHVLDADRLASPGGADDHRHHPLRQTHVQAAENAGATERLVDVHELHRVGPAGRVHAVAVPLVLLFRSARWWGGTGRLLIHYGYTR